VYHEDLVEDITLNRRAFEKRDEYHVPVARLHRRVTSEDVDRNREKWLGAAEPAP
jgi:hypothetical protein